MQVRMTVSAAQEFRAKGAALAKARTEGFSGLYFGICSTLSTRVRIEVTYFEFELTEQMTKLASAVL